MARALSSPISRVALSLSSLVLPLGCTAAPPLGEALADTVVDAPGATGDGYADPTRAIDGVRGGGYLAGSTDVYSLDYTDRPSLTLRWSGRRVVDGPGADLVVFENAFRTTWSDDAYFMDPMVVSVSLDGTRWVELPHHYLATDPTMYSTAITDWEGFAGCTPVVVNDETSPMSYFDPRAGGDAFDLAELGETGDEGEIRAQGFRFVRLESAALLVDPRTGAPYPHDAISNGADIDGAAARTFASDP